MLFTALWFYWHVETTVVVTIVALSVTWCHSVHTAVLLRCDPGNNNTTPVPAHHPATTVIMEWLSVTITQPLTIGMNDKHYGSCVFYKYLNKGTFPKKIITYFHKNVKSRFKDPPTRHICTILICKNLHWRTPLSHTTNSAQMNHPNNIKICQISDFQLR